MTGSSATSTRRVGTLRRERRRRLGGGGWRWPCSTWWSMARQLAARRGGPARLGGRFDPIWDAFEPSEGGFSPGSPLEPLDDRDVGLPAALAHGLEAVAAAGALELVEQGGHETG